ncbi:hypothetical protein ACGGZK_17250 [Agromyces sp. MMS24-K17]|uniref:hypothetical protein n=1 Tax=Agromyces sp. MMS24-K17 TaxID=3372850 RepID=UPI003753EFEF
MDDRARRNTQVLELRVHGIANAPPAVMLEVDPTDVRRRIGDDLGSFWVRKNEEPDPKTGIASTEAYSWGALARTGGTALALIGRAFVHIGWLFILPFGICNLAYWTRDIPGQKQDSEGWRGGDGAALLRLFALVLTLIYAAAFMTVAVDLVGVQCFDGKTVCAVLPSWLDGLNGLDRDGRAALLSLVPVAAMLLIYLIARSGRVHWEPNLNAFAERFLGTPTEESVAPRQPEKPVTRPLLATRGFWTRARAGATSERLHFAGTIALVVFLLCWDGVFQPLGGSCADPDRFVSLGCLGDAIAAGGSIASTFWIGVAAMLILAGVVIGIISASASRSVNGDIAKRAIAAVLLALACAAYVAYLVIALWPAGPAASAEASTVTGGPFLGLIVTPTTLLTVALGLAFIGGAWGTHASRVLSVTLVSLAGLAFAVTGWAPDFGWALTLGGILLLLIHFGSLVGADVSRRRHPKAQHRTFRGEEQPPPRLFAGDLSVVGWRGFGAMVGMLAALLVAMIISSLLVLGVMGWLGPAPSGAVAGGRRTPATELLGPLVPPVAYGRFAVVLTVIVIVMGLLIAIVLLPKLAVMPKFTVPVLDPPEVPGTDTPYGGVVTPSAGYAEREGSEQPGPVRRILTVRRRSQLLHRGEILLTWLASLSALGFLVFASPWGYEAIAGWIPDEIRHGIREASIAVLVTVSLAAVAAVVAHASTTTERPLALFWDIMCFFPRAGHPFGPPCYSERTVPELSGRIRAWLTDDADGNGAVRDDRAVVIAAWSMGGPVAVSAIFALTDNVAREHTDTMRSIALLTYGTQLRAFFSRFFPSVLGPDDLGIEGVLGPSLFLRDPWKRQVKREWPDVFEGAGSDSSSRGTTGRTTAATGVPASSADGKTATAEEEEPEQVRAFTLRSLLGGGDRPAVDEHVRWASLWRRTDPLGFPVQGYRANPIDRGAVERAATTYLWQVAAHGDYPGTAQYAAARKALVDRLKAVPDLERSEPEQADRGAQR